MPAIAHGVRMQRIFRAVARLGKVWGRGISQNVVWYVVRTCCEKAGLERIAPHDLRRTCAKLCHDRGGELEQIQFLLGHASVQTTEHYLGCKQNLGHPVNDLFDLGTESVRQEKDEKFAHTSVSTEVVEKPFRQGIECHHGGSEDERLNCDSKHVPLSERTELVEIGKSHRPESIRRCSETRTSGDYAGSKTDGKQIKEPADVWELERCLTRRRKDIDRKYDFRLSRLTQVFGTLLCEGRASEEELRGLREDKVKAIRSATVLSDDAA